MGAALTVTSALAVTLSAAGLVVGAVGALTTRHLRAGVPMMLELWTAAGLIKLSGDPSWPSIILAAIVIGLRRLVTFGLRDPATSR